MELKVSDTLFHLADQLVARGMIVASHRDAPAPSFIHQTAPTI